MNLESIINILKKRHLTLSTAESCTAGRVSAMISSISGVSEVFIGGVVAYNSDIKSQLLGVNKNDIELYDVVSEQVVKQMVKGVCTLMNSDIAIAVSGYAGPTTGNPHIPVGTIWIACGTNNTIFTKCLHLNNDRIKNAERATNEALILLSDFLSSL